jgi:hypothetical protein
MLRQSMLRTFLGLALVGVVWGSSIQAAAAQHERAYEFEGTQVALSIERFMGVDYTDFEGPGGSDVSARLLLNASEPVPTSYARFGLDVFIHRLSIGLAGGVTSDDVAIIAPRIGYLFGLTPTVGLWLRGGGFYASSGSSPAPNYLGIYAEALIGWFPYSVLAFTLGPTVDIAFANDDNRDYVSIGIPEVGMTAWF